GICAAMRRLLFWEHAGGALWGNNFAIAAKLRSRDVMEKASTQSVLSEISQIKSDLHQDLRKRLRDVHEEMLLDSVFTALHLQPIPLAFNVSEERAKAASLWKWKQWDLNYHLLSADKLIHERDLQRRGWEKK
ncbi:hypothetical protein K470DRAFT_260674, partial [Piedraia hortae CBS 480.64]